MSIICDIMIEEGSVCSEGAVELAPEDDARFFVEVGQPHGLQRKSYVILLGHLDKLYKGVEKHFRAERLREAENSGRDRWDCD